MKTDCYTKMVLTIIAAALVYLCALQTAGIQTVHAHSQTDVITAANVRANPDDLGSSAVPVVIVHLKKNENGKFVWTY